MIQYKVLEFSEINRDLFSYFQRKQIVTKCWRKVEGQWVIKDIAFVDDWTETDYKVLIEDLQNTAKRQGKVSGAFEGNVLKGFVSINPERFGSRRQYVDLVHIYVSLDMQGRGIGRELFKKAKDFAGQLGAEKLYISAHSAVESQAFYRAMGCVEAEEYEKNHVEMEPCDCQLECNV